jgi:hypothetical protein
MERRKILVVANQTAAGAPLRAEIKRRMESAPCKFVLVVPATPPHEHATYTEGEAAAIARDRMEEAVAALRGLGTDIEGRVGDASPVLAIGDTLIEHPDADEIILSTLPPGASRWLKRDLPHRVEQRFRLPVTTVIAESTRATS